MYEDLKKLWDLKPFLENVPKADPVCRMLINDNRKSNSTP